MSGPPDLKHRLGFWKELAKIVGSTGREKAILGILFLLDVIVERASEA